MEEAAPALRALGLVGICRETLRVTRSQPPGSAFLAGQVLVLTLSLLAHIAVCPALFSYALASSDAGAGLLRLAINWAPFFLVEAACLLAIAVQSLGATAFVLFSVGPRYGARDDRACGLVVTSFDAFLLLLGCTAVFTVTLVGCILAVQLAFSALVVHDVMGLGVWLRVAAGVVMAVALWAALMAGLVALVVLFFVCKSHHPERFVNVANVGRRL